MSQSTEVLVEEMQGVFARADAVERGLTETESARVEQILGVLQSRKAMDEAGRALGVSLRNPGFGAGGGAMSGDPGSRFVNSDGFKAISDSGSRGERFSTGLVDVGPGGGMADYRRKSGELFEGNGAPGDGYGGGLIPVPQVIPGVVTRLFQPLRLEELLDAGQATSPVVRYIVEGTATSGAAGVLEGGVKPASTLALSTQDEPVRKIATSLIISDEMLEDVDQLSSYVNGRLSLFVQQEVERQLLRGTAGNELAGLFGNVPIYAGGTAVGTYADQLFTAMNGVRGSAFTEPQWIVMHPTDYQHMRLLKDSNQQYYGGGPFLGSYSGVQQADASGQITGAVDQIWGKPVHVTPNVGGAGTALIGNSQAAQVWSRGGLSLEATNAHASLFLSDEVAIRCERRLALTLYRPVSFCEVRLA
jgi:HK97 family phage major capsid protein